MDTDSKLLIAEPKLHVSGAMFEHTVTQFRENGMEPVEFPKVFFSRAVLFRKSG
jgi:hypothetical protein